MATIETVLQAGLLVILASASFAKFRDLAGFRDSLEQFGFPRSMIPALSVSVPSLEALIALAFAFDAYYGWAALAAIGLFIAFTAVIELSLRGGRRPTCYCFGRISASPIGRQSVVRNAVFGIAAAFVAWESRYKPNYGIGRVTEELLVSTELYFVLLLVVVVTMIVLMLRLIRQYATVLVQLGALQKIVGTDAVATDEDLPIGAQAPEFEIPDLDGVPVTLQSLLRAQSPVILVFASPDCAPCNELMPLIGSMQEHYSHMVEIAILSSGSREINRQKATTFGLRNVLVQFDEIAGLNYRLKGVPSSVLIGLDGSILQPVVPGKEGVEEMIRSVQLYPIPLDDSMRLSADDQSR